MSPWDCSTADAVIMMRTNMTALYDDGQTAQHTPIYFSFMNLDLSFSEVAYQQEMHGSMHYYFHNAFHNASQVSH